MGENEMEINRCTRCGSTNSVEERDSFGIYAGRLCVKCAMKYRDHCGINQEQGNPYELDEQIDDDY